MNALDIMKRPAAYVSGYENTPIDSDCIGYDGKICADGRSG